MVNKTMVRFLYRIYVDRFGYNLATDFCQCTFYEQVI